MNQAIFESNAKLPEPWNERFPTSKEEMAAWAPSISIHALHRQVLCVAKTRAEGKWCVYLGVVPGMNHDNEWDAVARYGDKLPEDFARFIFPGFKDIPYAR